MYLHVAVQVAAIAETLGAQLALIGSFVVIVHLLTVQRLIAFALKRLQVKRIEFKFTQITFNCDITVKLTRSQRLQLN